MRGIVLQFLILFSVLCAGFHAPAAAHDDHGQATVLVADAHHAGDHEDFSDDSSSDPSQELYHHHHHCPMTTVFDGSDGAILAFANKELLWPSKAAALASLMPIPPTEPPAA